MGSEHSQDKATAREADRLFKEAVQVAERSGNQFVTHYLGDSAYKKICTSASSASLLTQEHYMVLFTLADLREAAVLMFRGRILQIQSLKLPSKHSAFHSLPTMAWCANRLNLPGYSLLFRPTTQVTFAAPLKNSAQDYTNRYRNAEQGRNEFLAYGDVETPGDHWKGWSQSVIYTFLDEIVHFINLKTYFPRHNNIDWTLEDYESALDKDAQILRARIGLSPAPTPWPEESRVILPAHFVEFSEFDKLYSEYLPTR